MATYLVTGCAGFIGSHLCDKLITQGHQVLGVDNFDPFYDRRIKERNIAQVQKSSLFKLYKSDICDEATWLGIKMKPDCVIHLGARGGVRPSLLNPESYVLNNVLGTQMLLNWMEKEEITKLVFASSSSLYGNNAKVPFSENDNTDHPVSPYAYTKKACELMISSYVHLFGIKALCLRLFTVYGPRQRPDLAIHKFTDLIFKGEPLELFGDGNSYRDYTYVDDIINGILQSIVFLDKYSNHSVFEIINLGNNKPVKLKDLIFTLMKLTDIKVPLHYEVKQAGDVDRTYADISKAQHLLGFHPETDFQTGLKKFIKWYQCE